MGVKKLSVALDSAVAEAAAAAAQARGLSLSAWLTDAARNQLRTEQGLAAVHQWEREHGELSDDERASGRALLHALVEQVSRRSA